MPDTASNIQPSAEFGPRKAEVSEALNERVLLIWRVNLMLKLIVSITAAGFAWFALVEVSLAKDAVTPGSESSVQSTKPVTSSRLPLKVRFEAVKKRLARDRAKFQECNLKLEQAKEKRRMHIWKQIHFLEDCMRTKP